MNAKRFQFGVIIIAVLVALNTATIAQTTIQSNIGPRAAKKKDITGVWLGNLDINAEAAVVPQMAKWLSSASTQGPFIQVLAFHSDGTFIETSLTDYLPPQGTPGQGVWEKTGNREFALTFYGVLVGNVSTPDFAGTYKVRSKLTLDESGDQYSGPFIVDVFDPAGNLVATLDGTAHARRAVSEPLP